MFFAVSYSQHIQVFCFSPAMDLSSRLVHPPCLLVHPPCCFVQPLWLFVHPHCSAYWMDCFLPRTTDLTIHISMGYYGDHAIYTK